MKKSTVKIPNELEDDLRPHYDVDYNKSRSNRFAGRVRFTHGGARRGAGRKPAPEAVERHTITLYLSHARYLRRLDANLSRAIRKLITSRRK